MIIAEATIVLAAVLLGNWPAKMGLSGGIFVVDNHHKMLLLNEVKLGAKWRSHILGHTDAHTVIISHG